MNPVKLSCYLYRGLYIVSRRLFSKPPMFSFAQRIWVIGSLRAGGAGRTRLSLALYKLLSKDQQVVVLCHRLHSKYTGWVHPEDDFPQFSDDGLWFAREGVEKVWQTNNRPRDLLILQKEYPQALFLCDGGYEDPRLEPCKRFLIQRGESPQSISELLPVGPYRSFYQDHPKPDLEWGDQKGALELSFAIEEGFVLVENFLFACASGNPKQALKFLAEINRIPQKTLICKDHDVHFLKKLEKWIVDQPLLPLFLTEKDRVKIPQNHPLLKRITVIPLRIKVDFPQNLFSSWLNS